MTNPGRSKFDLRLCLDILAIALSLGAIFSQYHIFFIGRDSKILRVTILANSSLLAVDKNIREDIEILYKKQNVNNLSFVQVKLENVGNREISEDDYNEGKPLELIFPEKANILDAVVLDRNPKNVELKVEPKKNVVILSPALLNPADRVIIRVLLTDMPTGNQEKLFNMEGRIKAGDIQLFNAIEQNESIRKSTIDWIDLSLVILLIVLILWIYFSLKRKP